MNPAPRQLPDRLTDERTVLVVVDIQEKFRDKIHGIDRGAYFGRGLAGDCGVWRCTAKPDQAPVGHVHHRLARRCFDDPRFQPQRRRRRAGCGP